MIVGAVTANREATVRLPVYGADAQADQADAVIDTGFALGLEWRGREEGALADGSLQLFDVYAATVIWDGRSRTVADATDSVPLIGMSLMCGHDLRIHSEERAQTCPCIQVRHPSRMLPGRPGRS